MGWPGVYKDGFRPKDASGTRRAAGDRVGNDVDAQAKRWPSRWPSSPRPAAPPGTGLGIQGLYYGRRRCNALLCDAPGSRNEATVGDERRWLGVISVGERSSRCRHHPRRGGVLIDPLLSSNDNLQRKHQCGPAPCGPMCLRPYGLRPYGLRPYGLRPYGLRPYGLRRLGSGVPGRHTAVL
ncbi:unnamed protein product [Boreogadus saida]